MYLKKINEYFSWYYSVSILFCSTDIMSKQIGTDLLSEISKFLSPSDVASAIHQMSLLDDNKINHHEINKRYFREHLDGKTVVIQGNVTKTYKYGKLHSFLDKPSYVKRGREEIVYKWHKNGKLDRGDKPAIIKENTETNTKFFFEWYKGGKKDRDNDLPASIHVEGFHAWYKGGKQHRDNGLPAFIELNDNCKEWWVNGVRTN